MSVALPGDLYFNGSVNNILVLWSHLSEKEKKTEIRIGEKKKSTKNTNHPSKNHAMVTFGNIYIMFSVPKKCMRVEKTYSIHCNI